MSVVGKKLPRMDLLPWNGELLAPDKSPAVPYVTPEAVVIVPAFAKSMSNDVWA